MHKKLELTWYGKDEKRILEPRILLEQPEMSYRANPQSHLNENATFDNRLIFGDNLLALRALENEFEGRIQCIYADPPFNTGQAFEYYDDGLEHSIWLSLMRDRFSILKKLLHETGSIFVHIDDNELGRLIVLLDEIFGEKNRVSIITFKQGAATGHKSINPGPTTISNYILVYAKNKSLWKYNDVYTERERDTRYSQFIFNKNEPYENWKIGTLTEAFSNKMNIEPRALKRTLGDRYEKLLNEFVLENAESVIRLARPDYNAVSAAARNTIDQSKDDPNRIFLLEREDHSSMYFAHGERILFYSDKLKLIDGRYVAGERLTNIWDDLLSNNLHNEGGVKFPKGKKPEALIKRILELSTNPGDWVLDSFAGSGTTGAVAHKMGRQWIMVELGEHCHTHIIPRMKNVIDGLDTSGVTKAVNWKGGGGFRYYHLASSLLEKDKHGHWVINRKYDAAMLTKAMCIHEGFEYAPDDVFYWKQGRSTENDFIYTTSELITREIVDQIQMQMKEEETLLVCCKAFNVNPEDYPNITIKKIPSSVLGRCEFGRDDYSLDVVDASKPEQDTVEV